MKGLLHYKEVFVWLALICCQLVAAYDAYAGLKGDNVMIMQPDKALDKIKFDSYTWNFGDITEDGGVVEHKFTFTNLSDKPVVILDVTTGCGCTTASYSRKPVMSGEQGDIVIVFDPMTRPGRFTKGAMIYTSASTNGISLTLEGNVIPRKKTLEEEYPFDLGQGVRITSNFHTFAYVGRGEKVEQRIGWVNTSTRDVTFKTIAKEHSGMLHLEAPSVMKAGARGEMVLGYHIPENSGRYGTLNDLLAMYVSGREAQHLLSAQVIAVDKYDGSSDDISGPIVELSKKIIKFGDVKHGKKVSDNSIILMNDGVNDLIIREVECQTKALECSLKAGYKLKAGERVALNFTLDSSQCDYDLWVDRVRIITNDTHHPMQSIRLTAIITE